MSGGDAAAHFSSVSRAAVFALSFSNSTAVAAGSLIARQSERNGSADRSRPVGSGTGGGSSIVFVFGVGASVHRVAATALEGTRR